MGKTSKVFMYGMIILGIIHILLYYITKNPDPNFDLGLFIFLFIFVIMPLFIIFLAILSVISSREAEKEYVRQRHYVCESCDYEWMSKKSVGVPSKCPNCNSKNIKRANKKV